MSIDRRAMLTGTMGLAAAGMLWGCVAKGEACALSERQMALLNQVADLVIPPTKTPR